MTPEKCVFEGCLAAPDYLTTVTFPDGGRWVLGQCWGHAPHTRTELDHLARTLRARRVAVALVRA